MSLNTSVKAKSPTNANIGVKASTPAATAQTQDPRPSSVRAKSGQGNASYTLTYKGNQYALTQPQIDWVKDRYAKSYPDAYKVSAADTERDLAGAMPSVYEKSYTRSTLDQKLYGMGLPSMKYLGEFMREYDDWYGDGTKYEFDSTQSDYLSKEYKKTWQYDWTEEDQARQKQGVMPVATEKAYKDNYTDYNLMQAGLPPTSKLGDFVNSYNTVAGQKSRISQFYSTLAVNVYGLSLNGIENDSSTRDVPTINTTDKGAVGIGVAGLDTGSIKGKGISRIGKSDNPTVQVAGATDWENAYYDLLLSPEWADVAALHKDTQSNIDTKVYPTNEARREAQVKLALKTATPDETPFSSYDDFLDYYNVRGGKKTIYQTSIVDQAVIDYGVDTYGELVDVANKERAKTQYAGINNRATARAFADDVIKTDPNYDAPALLQDMVDNGVGINQVQQAMNVFKKNAKSDAEKAALEDKYASLRDYTPSSYGTAAKVPESVGSKLNEAATLMYGSNDEKAKLISGYADTNDRAVQVRKENARIDRLVRDGIAGAYDKSLFATASKESASKTVDKYVTYDGDVPDSSSVDAAKKALSAQGYNAREIEIAVSENLSSRNNPTFMERVGEIAPSLLRITQGDVPTLVNETIKAGYSVYNSLNKPDASSLEIKEMFDDLRSRNVVSGLSLDNAMRRAGYSYMLDPTESAMNYFLEVEAPQAGLSPEKAISEWNAIGDNAKQLYADNFAKNEASNPMVHKTVEDVLTNQGITSVLPKVLASVADAGVGVAGLVVNSPNKEADWVKEASAWIDGIRNYGRSDQSLFTQGVSLASDAGAELAMMYGLNAAGGALMSGTKVGAKLATSAAANGATFLTKAAASTYRSMPFLARSFGTYYTGAIKQGAPVEQAKIYALVAGGMEGWLESWTLDKTWGRLFGSENMAKAIKSGGDKALSGGMKTTAKLMSLSTAFFGEASEEGISYATSWALSAAQGWNKDPFSLTEMGGQALMGGIIGMLGGALSAPSMSAQNILSEYMIQSDDYNTSNNDLLFSAALSSGVTDDMKAQYIAQGYGAILSVKDYAENQQTLTDSRTQLIQGKNDSALRLQEMEISYKDDLARAVSAESLVSQMNDDPLVDKSSQKYLTALSASAKIGSSKQVTSRYEAAVQQYKDGYENTTDQQNRSIEKAKAKQAAHHVVLTHMFAPEIEAARKFTDANSVNRVALSAQIMSGKGINSALDVGNLDEISLNAYDNAVKARGNAFSATEATGSAIGSAEIQSAIRSKMDAMRSGNVKEFMEAERAVSEEKAAILTKEQAIIDASMTRMAKYSDGVSSLISLQFPNSANPRNLDKFQERIAAISVDILNGSDTYADEYTMLQAVNDAIGLVEIESPDADLGTEALYGHSVKRILDKVQNTKFYQNQNDAMSKKTTRLFTDEELANVRGNLVFTKGDKNGQSFQAYYDSLVRDYPAQFPASSGTSALSILNNFLTKAKTPKLIALGTISNGDVAFDMAEMISADLMDDLTDAYTKIQGIKEAEPASTERGTANEQKPVPSVEEKAAPEGGVGQVEDVQAAFDFASQPDEETRVAPARVALTTDEMNEIVELGNSLGKPVQFITMDDYTDGEFGPNGIVLNTNQVPQEGFPTKGVVKQIYFHELLHSLKGTPRYNEFADFVVTSAAQKQGVPANELYSMIQQHRKAFKGIDLSLAAARDELVSIFAAENLDTNQQFVDDLVREKSGVAGRILNWIHYNMRLVKAKFSPNSVEMTTLAKMERLFTKAFAAQDKSATEDVRYSVSSGAGATAPDAAPPQQDSTVDDVRYAISGGGMTTLSDLVKKYGAIEPGKGPVGRNVDVPRKGANGENVQYTVRSFIEAVNTSDEVANTLKTGIENGTLGTYKAQSNKETLDKAQAMIADLGGYDAAINFYVNAASNGMIKQGDSASMTAMAEQLAVDAMDRGDTVAALDLVSSIALSGTYSGRDVQIRSILKSLKGLGQAYYMEKWVAKYNNENADAIKSGKQPQVVVDAALMQDLTAAKTPAEINAALDAVYRNIGPQIPMNALERLEQWRYFSMLANPITHVRNFVSTGVATGGMRPAANFIAAKMEDSWTKNGKMNQSDRRHSIYSKKTHPAEFEFADQMWDKYKGTVMAGGKYNIESQITKYQQMSKSKGIDSAMKLNSMALEKEDAFWMRRAFRDEFAQYMLGQGLSPATMTPAQELESAQHAADQARHSAFRDASTAAKTLTNLSNRYKQNPTVWNYALHGIVEGGMPFKKTPINVVKVGIEYSPIGLVRGLYDAANNVKSGKVEPAVAIERISRGAVGSAMTVIGALANALGVLRGAGEDDDKYDKYMRDKGEQKFSLSFGGVSISLAAISPATMPLFLGAALYDIASRDYDGAEPRDVLGQLGSALAGIVDPIMELSFMSSLNQIIQTFGGNDAVGGSVGSIVAEALGSYASQFVPTIGGKLSQMTGEYYRNTLGDATSVLGPEPDTWLRKQAKKIPGLANTLEPTTSLFGEKKQRPVLFDGDSFGLWLLDFANSFVLPGNIKIKDRDSVDEELIRVYESTGESGILPTYRQNKYFTVDGKDLYMNAKQYTQYSVERGQSIYSALKSAMLSATYQSSNYEQRSDFLDSAVSNAIESVDDQWKVKLYDAAN